jgi:hypothetical protein
LGAGSYQGNPVPAQPMPLQGGGGAVSPSVPQPVPAMPRYTPPIQQTPAPMMPSTPRPVAPIQQAPPPPMMMQTPAQPEQVRQQLLTALGGRPGLGSF